MFAGDMGDHGHEFDDIGRKFWMQEYRFMCNTLYRKSKYIEVLEKLFIEVSNGTAHHCRLPPLLNAEADAVGIERALEDDFRFFTDEDALIIDPAFEHGQLYIPTVALLDDDDTERMSCKEDQKLVLAHLIDIISNDATSETAIRMILCGPPGCGKSYLMGLIACLMLSKGITEIMFTCVASSRAKDLGGMYLHQLLNMGMFISWATDI